MKITFPYHKNSVRQKLKALLDARVGLDEPRVGLVE